MTDPAPPPPLLTIDDLALYLSLSHRAARQVLERGELPGFRIGKRWYVRPQDLEAAVAKMAGAPSPDPDAAVRILRGLPARSPARTPAKTPARRSRGSP